jgi:hypothetical protein
MATETITDTNRGATPHTPRPTKKQAENQRRSEMETNPASEFLRNLDPDNLPPVVQQGLAKIFGEPIHTYTRAQAIEDGMLVDVSETAREAGFQVPVAMTRAAWADCVEWTEGDSKRQVYQDEAGRLWDVLWMAMNAARRGGGRQSLQFQFYRVPRGGRGVRPRLTTLECHIGPGDLGEPVITIMQPGED